MASIDSLSPSERKALLAKLLAEKEKAASLVIPRGGSLPLTFNQERLWIQEQMDPGAASLVVCGACRLHGALDPGAMGRAVAGLVARHEVLRATFELQAGGPRAVPDRAAPPRLEYEDWSDLDDAAQRARFEAQADSRFAVGFDLTRGPLLRVVLAKLSPDVHLLVISVHDLVCDWRSFQLITQELIALYSVETGSAGAAPEAPTLQCADLAGWERAQLEGQKAEPHLAYWKKVFEAPTQLVTLPREPQPGVAPYTRRWVIAQIPAASVDALRAHGTRLRASLHSLVMTLYGATLGRYGPQSVDLLIGTLSAGAQPRAFDRVVGSVSNTLPVRLPVDRRQSYADWVGRVRGEVLEALSHQVVPFQRIVEVVRPDRAFDRTPLINVLFDLRPPPPALVTPGFKAELEPVLRGGMRFDLVLFAEDNGPGRDMTLRLIYRADQFTERFARQIADEMVAAAGQVAADVNAPLERVLALPADELATVQRFENAPRPLPFEDLLVSRSAHWAKVRPDAEALFETKGSTTWAQLEARSNQLAHHLRALGVGRESRVGLMLERGGAQVVAVLAVLKAGGVFVPIDTLYPLARIELMLRDCQPKLMLGHRHTLAPIAHLGLPSLAIDDQAAAIAARPTTSLPEPRHPEQGAYIIYTSGSTGTPRGVLIPHASLERFLHAVRAAVPQPPGVRCNFGFSFSFDVWQHDFVALLDFGGVACLPNDEERVPGPALAEWLRRARVSSAFMVPSAIAAMPDGALGPVEHLLAIGEALPPELVNRAQPGRAMYNMYGPTEATVWISHSQVTAGQGRAPIGGPAQHAAFYVLDEQQRRVPVGAEGELYLGGFALARGYIGRPVDTAVRFVPDPFAPTPGARMYATGDRARWGADGQVDFIGRIDGQVKLRGHRIELGEIENTLAGAEGVKAAAVVMRTPAGQPAHLAAYVALEPGVGPERVDAVRAHAKQRLPSYMIPNTITVLPELPRAPGGKLDRKALLALKVDRPPPAPLSTALERRMAALWERLLGVAPGRDDEFFALGGSSLQVPQLVELVRSELAISLPIRTLYEAPVLGDLCQRAEALSASGPR